MRTLLAPAVALMNRMKYIQKVSFIGVLFALPFAFTLYLLISDVNRQIDFTEKERSGLAYIVKIRAFAEHLQRHRGMVNAYMTGDDSFRGLIAEEEQRIGEVIAAVDAADAKWGQRLKTDKEWIELKARWNDLLTRTSPFQPQFNPAMREQYFDDHTYFIADVLRFCGHIKNNSGLQTDPGHDSYILMDSMLGTIIGTAETVGQVRGGGSGIAAKGAITPEQKTRLVMLSGSIHSALAALERQTEELNDEELSVRLQPYLLSKTAAVDSFMTTVREELIDRETIGIRPIDLFTRGTVAVEAGYRLFDAESPELDRLLAERIASLTVRIQWVAAVAFIAFGLIAYLFGAFYVSVTRAVLTLKTVSKRIAEGDLSARANLEARDELGQVGDAFDRMVEAFDGMLKERRSYEKQIEELAYYDSLTGLPNRVLFQERFHMAISDAKRKGEMVAVIFIDLDRFKSINDTLGHDAGDTLLKTAALRLQARVRRTDTVSRMGGDEFIVILSGIKRVDEAIKAAEHILRLLGTPITVNEHELVVSASMGISFYPHDGEDVETLVKHADIAMYQAKSGGRNMYRLYDREMNAKAHQRLQTEISLRRAIDRGEFVLHYQPRLAAESGTVVGMEALIRWQHPEQGLVPPAQFIPVAEESGLIVPIGDWVLRSACFQMKQWQRQGLELARICVNISMVQFMRERFVDEVEAALADYELHPRYLELELTESIIMKDAPGTIAKLSELRALGISISIDDFGTGFSSLSYLKHLPIDTLKIDRSFIKDVPHAPKDTAITKTIIALGRRLNVNVVAEGVESEEQMQFLAARKCNEVQGYWISRPVPPDEAAELLGKHFRSVHQSAVGDE